MKKILSTFISLGLMLCCAYSVSAGERKICASDGKHTVYIEDSEFDENRKNLYDEMGNRIVGNQEINVLGMKNGYVFYCKSGCVWRYPIEGDHEEYLTSLMAYEDVEYDGISGDVYPDLIYITDPFFQRWNLSYVKFNTPDASRGHIDENTVTGFSSPRHFGLYGGYLYYIEEKSEDNTVLFRVVRSDTDGKNPETLLDWTNQFDTCLGTSDNYAFFRDSSLNYYRFSFHNKTIEPATTDDYYKVHAVTDENGTPYYYRIYLGSHEPYLCKGNELLTQTEALSRFFDDVTTHKVDILNVVYDNIIYTDNEGSELYAINSNTGEPVELPLQYEYTAPISEATVTETRGNNYISDDIKSLYKSVLSTGMYPDSNIYVLYDIDKNGMPELIIIDADNGIGREDKIYTYNDGGLQQLSLETEFNPTALKGFFRCDDGNGMYEVISNFGITILSKYTLQDGVLVYSEKLMECNTDIYDGSQKFYIGERETDIEEFEKSSIHIQMIKSLKRHIQMMFH